MNQDNNILKISPDVSWVGVLDKDLKVFDIVMETLYGTTYNAYFINAQKKTLIETVKATFWEPYKKKLEQVCNISEIEYIVLDHTEPDHSGSLPYLLELAPNATVVGSGQALNYLSEMMDKPFKSLKVQDGDVLDLGNKKLKFIGAPNLHWPDSIYTWLEEDRLLFTCDSFGAHFCPVNVLDEHEEGYDKAFDHYFDVILRPFSKFMIRAIEKIKDLPIQAICTGHGPILRTRWKERVEQSQERSREYLSFTGEKKILEVLVLYVSAYGYTKQQAEAIMEGLKQHENLNITCLDVENILGGDLESALTKADGILIGSPTINQNTLLPVYKIFAYINPIRDRLKLAGSFGSFGWSGEASGIIYTNLKALKLKVIEPLAAKFIPNGKKNEEFIEYGRRFGEMMTQRNNTSTAS